MNHTESHTVPQLKAPIRLQEYGVGLFDSASTKSALKKVLKKQRITVDDLIATSATFIKGGECIRLSVEEDSALRRPLVFPLQVVYEDEYLAAIHKPAGIMVSGNSFKTIANALPQNLKRSKLPDASRPQPVHRLDYATTGILLVGKTASSIRALNKMFENRAVDKSYFAISIGRMDDHGKINSNVDGKASLSEYKVHDSVSSERFEQLNLVALSPHSGRRHQLRKHLSAIGHPILGDQVYGIDHLILKGKGLYLHAYSLQFIHPFTKEKLDLIDKLPERFGKIFPKKTNK